MYFTRLFPSLSDACELTLDPSTLQRQLCLSEGNRMVTWVEDCQPYPDHPERFGFHQQVLCREGLTGCCYWEAEWSGTIGVYIAVSYKGIGRKGVADLFGRNDKSWSLFCSPTSYLFRHNDHKTAVHGPISSRIGVYLNFWTGTLSFYSISDTMTPLHRVQTTFTEPLYPGFYICRTGTAVKLCSLRNESTYKGDWLASGMSAYILQLQSDWFFTQEFHDSIDWWVERWWWWLFGTGWIFSELSWLMFVLLLIKLKHFRFSFPDWDCLTLNAEGWAITTVGHIKQKFKGSAILTHFTYYEILSLICPKYYGWLTKNIFFVFTLIEMNWQVISSFEQITCIFF